MTIDEQTSTLSPSSLRFILISILCMVLFMTVCGTGHAAALSPLKGAAAENTAVTSPDRVDHEMDNISDRDLPAWLTAVQRRFASHPASAPETGPPFVSTPLPTPTSVPSSLQPGEISQKSYTGGDPFALPDHRPGRLAPTPALQRNGVPSTAALPPITLLGTLHDHGRMYALIGAGTTVLGVANGDALPMWPAAVVRITAYADQDIGRDAVRLEQATNTPMDATGPDDGRRDAITARQTTLQRGVPLSALQFNAIAPQTLSGKRKDPPLPGAHSAMSLSVDHIALPALLQIFARFCDINIIAGNDVTGAISVDLHDLSWPQALQAVLQSRGLDAQRSGVTEATDSDSADPRRHADILWVAPAEEIARRRKATRQLESDRLARLDAQSPLEGELFQLNYQKADTLRKLLHIGDDGRSKAGRGASGASGATAAGTGTGGGGTLLSARGSAIVDARSNQLLITDTPAALQRVRDLIDKIDIASRQVMIQAYIVEANHQFSRNLGVRLGFAGGADAGRDTNPPRGGGGGGGGAAAARGTPGRGGGRGGGGGPAATRLAATDDGGAAGDDAASGHYDMAALDLPARAIAGMRAGKLAMSLFNPLAAHLLTLELSALEADGKGRVVSSPRVVTADQQPALIEQGEEMPYQESAGDGATATAFKKANLKLEVTPQITPDNQVILRVDINKDSRGRATPAGLAINTRHIRTQVQVENDGTVVIGGIYTETTNDTVTKVPLLGDLPLLGYLFRSSTALHDKTELLIFLTPSILGADKPARRPSGSPPAAPSGTIVRPHRPVPPRTPLPTRPRPPIN